MRESVFQTEVVRSFLAEGHWAYKIPDLPIRRMIALGAAAYAADKPFDVVAFARQAALAIECKQMRRFEAFGAREMRESQVAAFDLITERGAGTAYVFLNVRFRGVNRLYPFRWPNLKRLWEREGSIKADVLRQLKHIEGHKGVFPLAHWLAAEERLREIA